MPDNVFDIPAEPIEENNPFAPAPAPEAALPVVTDESMTRKSLYEQAVIFSRASLLPAPLRGNPENCMLVMDMARRMHVSYVAVVNGVKIINNNFHLSSQLITSAVNGCGLFSRIKYEWFGKEGEDDWGCRAYVTELATGEVLTGAKVTWKMAKEEGWVNKSGSKWKTMPEQMFMYRAATFLGRAYMADLLSGSLTIDEMDDIQNVTPSGPVPVYEDTPAERAWKERQEDI